MNTNELRIGNLLMEDMTSSILVVSEIRQNGFTTIFVDRGKYPLPEGREATPINLTEKWLENLGFEFMGSTKEWQWRLKISAADLLCRADYRRFYFQFNETYLGDLFKNVHQIQNFCAALGKELEVKL